MIGHCARLFDAQGDDIENPYGSWMRAEPKRGAYAMGNKWLRSGGAITVNKAGGGNSDKSDAAIIATTITSDNRNLGLIQRPDYMGIW